MTKKVISIVSVLKPVDDTRNFEKIARSLGNTNKYEINIIGFSTKNIPSHPNINFLPIFNFRRTSFKRLFVPMRVLAIMIKLKPELIIVTCTELLIVITIYKIIFGCKIAYDIQENYYLNIRHSGAYGKFIKYPLSSLVRLNERICKPFMDRFLLAETVYTQQILLPHNKTIVLENKVVISPSLRLDKETASNTIKLVYTGTISEHYGIFDAISLANRLNKEGHDILLTIIGYASQKKIYELLTTSIKGKNHIKLIGGNELIPHQQIITELSNSDFCLMPYRENKSTAGRVPTKLFECLALEVPVIITPQSSLIPIIKENNAGIIYDFRKQDLLDIKALKKPFYGQNHSAKYLWEEEKLVPFIDELLD